jgi:putative cardiolipin synthase
VEAQFRIQMIRQAQHSIELITYDQRPDAEGGVPILDALEEAALKGVKVRAALGWFIAPVKDPFGHVKSRLKKIAARTKNFQFIRVGGKQMTSQGWKTMDGAHEKLMIIDGKWVMTTGRGQGEQYFHWLDSGFVFKGPLAHQSSIAFERLWAVLQRESPAKPQSKNRAAPSTSAHDIVNVSVPHNSITIPLSPFEAAEFKHLARWLIAPPSGTNDYRARVLHQDFLEQMREISDSQILKKKPRNFTFEQRLKLIIDPVVNEVVDLLNTAKSLKFYTLSVILHPKLKEAIIQRLKPAVKTAEPFHLQVFTNSKRSHKNIAPLGFSIGWYAGISDLDDLMQFGNAQGYLLRDRLSPADPLYLHRKLIIIDQPDSTKNERESSVIFGSHNLSFASSVTLDELSFQIESFEFAHRMNLLFQESILKFGKEVEKKRLHQERSRRGFSIFIDKHFGWAY